jgi:hypothetical protein
VALGGSLEVVKSDDRELTAFDVSAKSERERESDGCGGGGRYEDADWLRVVVRKETKLALAVGAAQPLRRDVDGVADDLQRASKGG